jgi:hypothetical protein
VRHVFAPHLGINGHQTGRPQYINETAERKVFAPHLGINGHQTGRPRCINETAERKVFQCTPDLAAPNSVSPLRLGAFAAAPLGPCKNTKTSVEMTRGEPVISTGVVEARSAETTERRNLARAVARIGCAQCVYSIPQYQQPSDRSTAMLQRSC